jgi:hypothetical protein
MKLESGLFAEVPHELVTARRLKPSVKVILKLYGTMSDGEREYEVFTFSPGGLVALLRTTAKTSVVVLRAANGDGATLETATDKLADNLSDNLSDKMSPRKEDPRKEEDRREEKTKKDLVASSSGTSPSAEGGCCVGMPSMTVSHPNVQQVFAAGVVCDLQLLQEEVNVVALEVVGFQAAPFGFDEPRVGADFDHSSMAETGAGVTALSPRVHKLPNEGLRLVRRLVAKVKEKIPGDGSAEEPHVSPRG